MIKLLKTYILALSLIPLATYEIKAQSFDMDVINQQDWITRQQQNKIEEDRRLREQEIIRKERIKKKKEEEEGWKRAQTLNKLAECFPIKTIKLTDANSLSNWQQKKLVAPFAGKCLDAKTLTKIITAVQNYYSKKGYVVARVSVPKQNIQSGNLELKILEGKIDEVVVGDNNLADKMQKLQLLVILRVRC
jgi:hemolysin activation/secretion protein